MFTLPRSVGDGNDTISPSLLLFFTLGSVTDHLLFQPFFFFFSRFDLQEIYDSAAK